MKRPSHLQNGDLVIITATARKISIEELEPAIQWLKANGLRVDFAPNLFSAHHQFAGTDDMRRADLQWCLDHPKAKAIWCARGGYGTVRIIDELNWEGFKAKPKWITGYSDVTALHGMVNAMGIESLHATMPINIATNTGTALTSLMQIWSGADTGLNAPSHALSLAGTAEGTLIGGNLSVLFSIQGSQSQPPLEGGILVLEDLDEYLYHIDRMMMGLKRSGWLKNLSGVIVGGMTDMNDNAIPFGEGAEEILHRHFATFSIPVGFGFPIGHLDNNCAIRLGAPVRLTVSDNGSSEFHYR